ncbi:MAG: hypothetical protein M5U31_15100 [Acidimicrobiia bacterium]|nr:hypothetical protein [Acidimicrobiia bacterium]
MMRPDAPNSLVLVAAAPTAATLAFGLDGSLAAVFTLVGLAASLAACRAARTAGRTPRALWPAVIGLAVLAVLRAPIGSHDLWSYVFYGRMVSHYGVDPYSAVPASFPNDIVYPLVGWRDTPSGYGPLFTLYSSAVTGVAGGSLLVMRLGFQLLAAGSVIWCLTTLRRAGRHATLVLVALQPFIWVSVVNGGHNDAVVAALLLAAVVAFGVGRVGRAAALGGIAALIKLSALPCSWSFLSWRCCLPGDDGAPQPSWLRVRLRPCLPVV